MHASYINVLITESSTCFENPSVHPQEDLQVKFYGISFMHPYKQSGPAIDQTACMDAWKKYHKISRTNLPEDEHLDVRNMSKTL